MQKKTFTYLFFVQYLGLRYAGWQKQKEKKTIQGSLEKAFRHTFGHEDFSLLGAGRTDAGVSANQAAFELFLPHEIKVTDICDEVNNNLPSDIRLIRAQGVDKKFNIIKSVLWKEYQYHMAFGEKFHPFAAGNLVHFKEEANIPLMKEGASLFLGRHDFKCFCSPDNISNDYVREIQISEIIPHAQAGQGLIPENALTFRVRGKGFLKYQVRIMAGALVDLGAGRLNLDDLKNALLSEEKKAISGKASAHGLVLEEVFFV